MNEATTKANLTPVEDIIKIMQAPGSDKLKEIALKTLEEIYKSL